MRLGELTPFIVVLHVFACMFGCVIGSFLNVVVWRVPQGMSLVSPPSHCPNCGHLIRAWENIPVLSWLCLRGRCSGCHQPISIRYPLGELATGMVYALVFFAAWRRNLPAAVIPGYFFLLGALVCVFQIDLRHRIIPDLITFTGMTVALLLALLLPGSRLIFNGDLENARHGTLLIRMAAHAVQEHCGMNLLEAPMLFAALDCVLGLAVGMALLGVYAVPGRWISHRLTNGRVTLMGMGDVKCLAMIGAFLGADAAVYVLCAASLAGFTWGVAMKVLRGRKFDGLVVFGPFLAVAAFAWMQLGRPF